ncbi:transmembrane protein 14C-like isoform X1 [Acipenser oxyrinchus oxyrinchus]|uniref:Transmembrane protein 14C n=1 Tax=Acipenser oxyrinchus oxyrinchus TaxID=40147 RepID=A0AAD8GDI0_ACIOX|nr:transmembrane protein 14C-like isoform X1 [Acipenser oxyrinchus oxyrinchus]
MSVEWIGFGYAALVASGGIIGYVKAGSVSSLAAGLLFGSLAGLGAYQMSHDPKNVWISLGKRSCLCSCTWTVTWAIAVDMRFLLVMCIPSYLSTF